MGGGEGGRGEPGVKNEFAPTVVVYHIDITHNRYNTNPTSAYLPFFMFSFLPVGFLKRKLRYR